MARTLIIGGAGFIGGHLARAVALAGGQVDILDDFSRGVRDPFLREIESAMGVRLIQNDEVLPIRDFRTYTMTISVFPDCGRVAYVALPGVQPPVYAPNVVASPVDDDFVADPDVDLMVDNDLIVDSDVDSLNCSEPEYNDLRCWQSYDGDWGWPHC